MSGLDVLGFLRGTADEPPIEEPEVTPAPVPATEAPGPGPAGQIRAAIEHIVTVGRAHAKARAARHGGLVNGLIHSDPPSVAEQMEYAHNRPWVKPGHEGGLFDRAGTRYQRRIGIPGVAFANLISGVFKRGIRALVAAVILTALSVAVLCALFTPEAVWIILGALGAWVATLAWLFI